MKTLSQRYKENLNDPIIAYVGIENKPICFKCAQEMEKDFAEDNPRTIVRKSEMEFKKEKVYCGRCEKEISA